MPKGKGGSIMVNSNAIEKTLKMKCPECLNFMVAKVHNNGYSSGKCPVCKAMVITKQHSSKEKLIRILKQN